MLPRNIDGSNEAKPGSADLVERDTADLARQSDGTADLVLDPTPRQLIRTHVGSRDVIDEIADRRGECPDQALLVAQRHLWVQAV